jgi:hypothetical protein
MHLTKKKKKKKKIINCLPFPLPLKYLCAKVVVIDDNNSNDNKMRSEIWHKFNGVNNNDNTFSFDFLMSCLKHFHQFPKVEALMREESKAHIKCTKK